MRDFKTKLPHVAAGHILRRSRQRERILPRVARKMITFCVWLVFGWILLGNLV